ncbi:hypothetical protein Lser_V15G05184 [Lactuca serriola]
MEKNLIGIKSRIEELYSLLCMKAKEEVRMVGVLGMGGIGKTTIAQALFRRISCMFEGCSFLEDVKENSSGKKGVRDLQEQILRDTLVTRRHNFLEGPEHGADVIRRRLCKKKVLLVLDDVDDVEQLEFLAGTPDWWFGPGSRIIITTRDERLLLDANVIYRPDFLCKSEAVELFCWHAFRKSSPPEGYEELSERVIRYAGCLPLALKVLGAFFRGGQVSVWESALDRLAEVPDGKIVDKLKLSFDGLHVLEKQIFLDIACFFKGKEVEHVTRVLDSFGFHPGKGISVLIEKCLITDYNKKLDMHDLIQEMGWQIVRESFVDSRLWKLDQIHDFIKGKKKQKAIEAIMMMDNEYLVDDYDGNLATSADVFAHMKNLRLLDIDGKFTSSIPTFLPDELRWLRWTEYPFLTLPLADRCKLVGLEMAKGNLKYLWKGQKILPNLKFVHLEWLPGLTSFPDVSGAPNIERLILSNCGKLEEVHESLGSHRRLVYLDMNGCRSLKCLPSRLEMESLETLILSGCESLERFPEVSPCMAKLSEINLDSCSNIKELPSSIRYLSGLRFLSLANCVKLNNIPNSICGLKYLKCLRLHNCVKLKNLPKELQKMKLLEELWLGFDDFKRPETCVGFHSFRGLLSLRKLDLSGRQIGEESFPENPDAFSSLEELYLSGNSKLVRLPSFISRLSCLKRLELNECCRLESLCMLPSSIQVLKANGCTSLRKIGDLSTEGKWLYKIWLINCQQLSEDEENQRYLHKMFQLSFIKKCAAVNHRLSIAIPGSKIPSWIKQQKRGDRIALKLPHKWHTRVMGFVVSGVFRGSWKSHLACPCITFSIVSDGNMIPKSEVDSMMLTTETDENKNVWICYMPLGFFQQMYQDLQPEDWSLIEGNLDITVMLRNGTRSLRCGAHIISKEDVQQTTTCISDYGSMVHFNDEDLGYDESISGNTYVYEEKLDEKSLMPLRSRTSTSRPTKEIFCIALSSSCGGI